MNVKDFCHWILHDCTLINMYVGVWQFIPYLFVRSAFINWPGDMVVVVVFFIELHTNYTVVGHFVKANGIWKQQQQQQRRWRRRHKKISKQQRKNGIQWFHDHVMTRALVLAFITDTWWTFTIWLPCRIFNCIGFQHVHCVRPLCGERTAEKKEQKKTNREREREGGNEQPRKYYKLHYIYRLRIALFAYGDHCLWALTCERGKCSCVRKRVWQGSFILCVHCVVYNNNGAAAAELSPPSSSSFFHPFVWLAPIKNKYETSSQSFNHVL